MTTERDRPQSAAPVGRLAGGRASLVLAATVLMVGGLVAAGCGGDSQVASGGEAESSKGEMTSPFSATTLDGTNFSHPTGKPTVLFFMAGWCTDCLPEATALDTLERELGEQVAILAVDADPTDPVESLRGFADTVGARYGFAHDPEGSLTGKFGVRSLDTTIVTDAAGRVVFRDAVPTKLSTLRAALERAGV